MSELLRVTATEIMQLQGNGGIPFREFMKKLINAHADFVGVPQQEIISDSENMKDGGCDLEIRVAAPNDETGFLLIPACWQFKGTEKKQISDADMQQEITKPYARKLIEKGYKYILSIADDMPPAEIDRREMVLLNEARKINPAAPPPRVFGATSLAEWATRYTAFVMESRRIEEFQIFDAWGRSVITLTHTYVSNPGWEAIAQQIQSHLNISNIPPDVCLTIRGAAGVGKTRLVYETINTIPSVRTLCLYTIDEKAAVRLATELSNQPNSRAIIVADECLNKARYNIERLLAGAKNRVRVIVINNADEPSSEMSPAPLLDRLPNGILENILRENFPATSREHRQVALDLANGFVKIAADICAYGVEKGIQRLDEYLRYRINDPNKLKVLNLIGLFERIGFKDDVKEEIDIISGISGITASDIRSCCLDMKQTPGFLTIGGRYYYVSPEAIAKICFSNAWSIWVEPDIGAFLARLSPGLLEALQKRIKKSASQQVRDNYIKTIENKGKQFEPSDLLDKKKAIKYVQLVETNPDLLLAGLRLAIEQSNEINNIPNQYGETGWGIRRNIVWLCEHLAPFPEYFYDVEAILFKLALSETEEKIGNNASAIWRQLFRVFLSGTSVPFEKRMELLEKRIADGNEQSALLALTALNEIFSSYVVRMGIPSVIAGKIPPIDWKPQTRKEESSCYEYALKLISQSNADARETIQERTLKIVVDNIYFFLGHHLFAQFTAIIEKSQFRIRQISAILDHIEDYLRISGDELPRDYYEMIVHWKNNIVPDDNILARVRATVGRKRAWMDKERKEFEQNIAALAKLLANTTPEFYKCLDWLLSDEALHAYELGEQIGYLDGEMKYFNIIRDRTTKQNSALLRGYIQGRTKSEEVPGNILEWLNAIEDTTPELAYEIALTIPDKCNGFERILRLFNDNRIAPRYLVNLQYRIELSQDRVKLLLNSLLSYSGQYSNEAMGSALDIAYCWFEDQKRKVKPVTKPDTELMLILESIIERAMPENDNETYHWEQLLELMGGFNPDLVIRKCSAALLGNLYLIDTAIAILSKMAPIKPRQVLCELTRVLFDQQDGWKIDMHSLADILNAIPVEEIMNWFNEKGIEIVRRFAVHLPKPYIDESQVPSLQEITKKVLQKYGDDEDVKRRFAQHSEIRTYSSAEQFLQEAQLAEKFLSHSLTAIRYWAENERKRGLFYAEQWKQEREEDTFMG